MSFYSWLDCSTQKSIANKHTGEHRTAYLLQPNGAPSIEEAAYDGYGTFAGRNVYAWFLENNAEHFGLTLDGLSERTKFCLGVEILDGHVYLDTATGEYWADEMMLVDAEGLGDALSEILKAPISFYEDEQLIPEFNEGVGKLMSTGRFKCVDISSCIEIKYPIKLSHNPEARYEDHPASAECPNQGFFM